jgi:hypothetical protein
VQNVDLIGAGFAEEDAVHVILINIISLDAPVNNIQLAYAVKIFF